MQRGCNPQPVEARHPTQESAVHRVQLNLTDPALAALDALKEKVGAASYAEVIRNALKLYDGVVTEGGPNARMVVDRPDGTMAIVRIFE